jgi:hypothetical protein
MYITNNMKPDHIAISKFRQRALPLFPAASPSSS